MKLLLLFCWVTTLVACPNFETNQSSGGASEMKNAQLSQTTTKEDSSDVRTILKDISYFKIGPQQASPPDGTFASGTKVTIVTQSGSYALVQTDEGIKGYVPITVLSSKK